MKILELIRDESVETQEELAERLRREGIQVTQATVSRDVKELQLVKVPAGEGRYRYAQPEDPSHAAQTDRMLRIFRECILGMEYSSNLIVVSTLPATAAAVAEAIDGLHYREVIGTLAGERNLFVVCRPPEASPQVMERLKHLMR